MVPRFVFVALLSLAGVSASKGNGMASFVQTDNEPISLGPHTKESTSDSFLAAPYTISVETGYPNESGEFSDAMEREAPDADGRHGPYTPDESLVTETGNAVVDALRKKHQVFLRVYQRMQL